jgi:hypothetical protein
MVAVARPSSPTQEAEAEVAGYFAWSRDPAVGLFAVLPLWLLYEVLRWRLAPFERNGAEDLVLHHLQRLDPRMLLVLRSALGLFVLGAAISLLRRNIPWFQVAAKNAVEGSLYGLLLGPLASWMTSGAVRVLDLEVWHPVQAGGRSLVADLVGSLGAGLFEELVFRLGLMSLLLWIGLRVVRAWTLPRWLAGLAAVVLSALVFAWFHHLCGEPFDRARFWFRTMAGVLLGALMWFRGFGVCVYTHTLYDTYYYLSTA